MVAKGIVKHISHISILILIYNGEKFIKGVELVSSFKFQVSGFRFQVSGFRFQVSGCGLNCVKPFPAAQEIPTSSDDNCSQMRGRIARFTSQWNSYLEYYTS